MVFARGENYQPPEIRQTWPEGPSRFWNQTKSSAAQTYYEGKMGGYVGSYVCQGCYQSVTGVYRCPMPKNVKKWFCAGCAGKNV